VLIGPRFAGIRTARSQKSEHLSSGGYVWGEEIRSTDPVMLASGEVVMWESAFC